MANGPVVSNPRQFGSLEFTLSATKAVYARGEQVPLTFTVKNVGMQTVNVTIATPAFDATITQNNQLVWQYTTSPLAGGGTGVIRTISIDPGVAETLDFTWDQKDQQGNSVMSGRYVVKAWFYPRSIDNTSVSQIQVESDLASNPIQIVTQ